ncbi:MAG: VF530 family protein [Shewanella sp.]|nr:VF530 family protein [Shewanella sp.]MCF1429632.1 VF530 family protein [Shewanella sp.]MCF1458412.1 VF530 family protein [Shewanella sp.]
MSQQANNPLHGIKLETLLTELVEILGWEELGSRIDIRCFTHDPSIKSSLKFLRKQQWARDKVEALYLDHKGIKVRNKPVSAKPRPAVKLTAQKTAAKGPGLTSGVNAHIWGK